MESIALQEIVTNCHEPVTNSSHSVVRIKSNRHTRHLIIALMLYAEVYKQLIAVGFTGWYEYAGYRYLGIFHVFYKISLNYISAVNPEEFFGWQLG